MSSKKLTIADLIANDCNEFPQNEQRRAAILNAVRDIPCGTTASYKQVAEAAGYPKNARLVGKILGQLTEPEQLEVPWHRVISSSGKISHRNTDGSMTEQRIRLEEEGIEFTASGRIRH